MLTITVNAADGGTIDAGRHGDRLDRERPGQLRRRTNTCTDGRGDGTCTVTITSAATGTTVVSATSTDISVDGIDHPHHQHGREHRGRRQRQREQDLGGREHRDHAGDGDQPGRHEPRADDHGERARTARSRGRHTATASIVSGPGSFVGSTTCSYTGGAATASCTVTITSAVAGTTVVSATSNIPVDGQSRSPAPPTRPSTRRPAAAATPRRTGS